jgi:hypothetical protein
MKKVLLTTLAGIALAAPAFAADSNYKTETEIERNDDGSYKKSVKAEHDSGAGKVTSETTTELDVDSDGDSVKKVVTKDVDDPKGLLNKQTTKTETKVEVEDGAVTKSATKTVNGRTVEEHEEKSSH